PFAHGYVTSLARPSGNITGIFLRQIELTVKRLQLVKMRSQTCRPRQCSGIGYRPTNGRQRETPALSSGCGLPESNCANSPMTTIVRSPRPRRTIVRTSSCWSHHSFFGIAHASPTWCGATVSHDVRLPRMGRGGWSAVLRAEHRRDVPTCGRVRGPDCEGSEANRPADRAADQVRTCGQPQD